MTRIVTLQRRKATPHLITTQRKTKTKNLRKVNHFANSVGANYLKVQSSVSAVATKLLMTNSKTTSQTLNILEKPRIHLIISRASSRISSTIRKINIERLKGSLIGRNMYNSKILTMNLIKRRDSQQSNVS